MSWLDRASTFEAAAADVQHPGQAKHLITFRERTAPFGRRYTYSTRSTPNVRRSVRQLQPAQGIWNAITDGSCWLLHGSIHTISITVLSVLCITVKLKA